MAKRKKTMFKPAKSKRLAGIVKMDNITNATKSASKLKGLFNRAKTRKYKVKIKRSTTLAYNRAGAMLKRKNLSTKEKRQFRRIREIFGKAKDRMKIKPK